jgi:hypothetical protein
MRSNTWDIAYQYGKVCVLEINAYGNVISYEDENGDAFNLTVSEENIEKNAGILGFAEIDIR